MTGINSPELERAVAAGVETALFASEARWRRRRNLVVCENSTEPKVTTGLLFRRPVACFSPWSR
jgi:hypothetical protein